MFTGLIETLGRIQAVEHQGGGLRLRIVPDAPLDDLAVGESIAVEGVCLTVTACGAPGFTADVSAETLARSTLGALRPGHRVNLERAMRLSERLGGHLVSGHVDGTGTIQKMEPRGEYWFIRIGIAPRLSRYTIEKGSVAVDGISLTINRCGEGFFEVNIIPETARATTLLKKRAGAKVNIETDLIGKYVEKLLQASSEKPPQGRSGLDMNTLRKHGFGD